MTKRVQQQSAGTKCILEENATCDCVQAGYQALACGGSCGYSCYEDAHCSFEGIITRVGVLAKSTHRQHEDADLQKESKDTEFVEVLQAQV